MIGVLVNTAAVIIGSTLGLVLKKGIPERFTSAVMTGIALCTLYLGFSGSLAGQNALVLIISMVLGAIIGTALDIDGHINAVGKWFEKRMSHKDTDSPSSETGMQENGGKKKASIAEGFMTACLLFCIGAMTIVGSLNAGLLGDNEMLFTKSLLDLISSVMLTASLGIGVMLAAIFVFVFQGSLVLAAGLLQPILNDFAIAEMSCAGSLLILALGLNLLGITKIKVANYLPALILAPIVCMFF